MPRYDTRCHVQWNSDFLMVFLNNLFTVLEFSRTSAAIRLGSWWWFDGSANLHSYFLSQRLNQEIMEKPCTSSTVNRQPCLPYSWIGQESTICERVETKCMLYTHQRAIEHAHIARPSIAQWQPPTSFLCPLVKTIMMLPMISLETGISFEYFAILQWCNKHGNICPVTGGALGKLIPNQHLQFQISEWQLQRKQFKASEKEQRRRHRYLMFAPNQESSTNKFPEPISSKDEEKLIECVQAHTKLKVEQCAKRREERTRLHNIERSRKKSYVGRSIHMQSFFPTQSNKKQPWLFFQYWYQHHVQPRNCYELFLVRKECQRILDVAQN